MSVNETQNAVKRFVSKIFLSLITVLISERIQGVIAPQKMNKLCGDLTVPVV